MNGTSCGLEPYLEVSSSCVSVTERTRDGRGQRIGTSKTVADAEQFHKRTAKTVAGTIRSPGFRTCTALEAWKHRV